MSAPRVVVIDHSGQPGGGQIALLRLLRALGPGWDVSVLLLSDGTFRHDLERAGIAVEVLALPERTVTQNRRGLTDPTVLVRSLRDSWTFSARLADRLRDIAPDLVVANTLKAAVMTELATWRHRVGWVWHLHDRLSSDYLPAPVVAAMRLLARRPRRVVANSVDVAVLTGLGPGRVTIAYPGLPADAFRDHHEPPDPPVFGLLGRISSTKGQREFIEAASIVVREYPDARFRIVGDALFTDQPYAEEVRALPSRLGVGDRVEFVGWVDDPRQAIDSFTALVHASPVPEPFGQVIVEAMARTVPVVATLGGGVGEILGVPRGTTLSSGEVRRTDVGWAVGPGDAAGLARGMIEILREPDQARRAAQRGEVRAREQFTAKETARAAEKAWRDAISD